MLQLTLEAARRMGAASRAQAVPQPECPFPRGGIVTGPNRDHTAGRRSRDEPDLKPDDPLTVAGKAGCVGYILGKTQLNPDRFVVKLNFPDGTGCYASHANGRWQIDEGSTCTNARLMTTR